ncbi:hypothetical protein EDD22DRAFT_618501 [Suillus occidentalis]|nr:hypothetical protein EDD22DRAFT_618501 [Suillus occidentalis]
MNLFVLAVLKFIMYGPLTRVSYEIVSRHRLLRSVQVLHSKLLFFLLVFHRNLLEKPAGAFDAFGLSLLLLCTLGLLHSTSQTPDGFLGYQRLVRFFQLLGTVAVILTILGVYYQMTRMLLVGVVLFAVLYIVLLGSCLYLWTQIRFLMRYRKQLLKAVSIALPLLTVRMVYGVLSMLSWDRYRIYSVTGWNLAAFGNHGEWQIYFTMEFLMEFAIVIIYSVAGHMLPLNEDYKIPESYEDECLLSRPHC